MKYSDFIFLNHFNYLKFFSYGNVLQQHGTKRGVMNPKNYIINFGPGERIKSVKVFRNSKFIVGIQFQTSQKNWTPVYGQETRLVTELKSPYSNKFYLKYFHGKSSFLWKCGKRLWSRWRNFYLIWLFWKINYFR